MILGDLLSKVEKRKIEGIRSERVLQKVSYMWRMFEI